METTATEVSGSRELKMEYETLNRAVQAAVLEVKLKHLEEWTDRRIANAARYTARLQGVRSLSLPVVSSEKRHVFHLYVVRTEGNFTGFLQHLVDNTQAGVVTDMSTVCALAGP